MVLLAIVIVAVVWIVMTYNNLVNLKHAVSKAWSNIDVLLKQRHDELPKLVETCKQYKEVRAGDAATGDRGARARARSPYQAGHPRARPGGVRAACRSRQASSRLVEAYPELKTVETFQHLLARITGLENAIADRREFYNESVNINNVRVEQFPDLVIAGFFRFKTFDLLRFSDAEKKDVDVRKLFS